MKVNYFLVASGSIGVPNLDIAIFTAGDEEDDNYATNKAEGIVGPLALAGYYQFTVWHTPEEGMHRAIASFKVTTPKPVVTREGAR